MVPRPVPDKPGLLTVDATWGTISPIQLAPGVRTVGELEVIDHIDGRTCRSWTRGWRTSTGRARIPSARNIPHEQIEQSINSLDPGLTTIFFCNGPQCAATPAAIRTLLTSGYPPESILYYRGGIHDWMTLGLPIEIPAV